MDPVKKIVVFIFVAACHFLLQTTMMLLSLAGKLVFYKESFWSLGGVLTSVSRVLYQVLGFPFIFIFKKWSISIPGVADAPYYLNSLLWASIITLIVVKTRKNRKSKYQFVRGVSR